MKQDWPVGQSASSVPVQAAPHDAVAAAASVPQRLSALRTSRQPGRGECVCCCCRHTMYARGVDEGTRGCTRMQAQNAGTECKLPSLQFATHAQLATAASASAQRRDEHDSLALPGHLSIANGRAGGQRTSHRNLSDTQQPVQVTQVLCSASWSHSRSAVVPTSQGRRQSRQARHGGSVRRCSSFTPSFTAHRGVWSAVLFQHASMSSGTTAGQVLA